MKRKVSSFPPPPPTRDNSFEKLRFEPIHSRYTREYIVFLTRAKKRPRERSDIRNGERKKDLRVLEYLVSGSLCVVKDAEAK